MIKRYALNFLFLISIVSMSTACNQARETASTSIPAENIPTAHVANPTPTPVTASPTLTQVPSSTPIPTSTLTAIPTNTQTPYLPADLDTISPQNASKLKQVAVLTDINASVAAYSSDGRWLAIGIFRTNQVKILDLANGEVSLTLNGHTDPRSIYYLAFSPDGTRLASGAQGWDEPNDSLIIWDTSTGREVQRFNGVVGAISPDWHLVALTQREREQANTLSLYDLTSGEKMHTLDAPGEIYGISFSPQGKQVAATMYSVYQDLFSFWWVDSGQLDRTLYDWVGFTYSADSRFIAAMVDIDTGDKGELNTLDAGTFKWLKTLAKDVDTLWYATPAFSPDGQVLAASRGDKVTLWDTETWKELIDIQTNGPTGIVFSPDGRLLSTSSLSGDVGLWGVPGGG